MADAALNEGEPLPPPQPPLPPLLPLPAGERKPGAEGEALHVGGPPLRLAEAARGGEARGRLHASVTANRLRRQRLRGREGGGRPAGIDTATYNTALPAESV